MNSTGQNYKNKGESFIHRKKLTHSKNDYPEELVQHGQAIRISYRPPVNFEDKKKIWPSVVLPVLIYASELYTPHDYVHTS